ncbi:BED zinc finger domain-containing protein [Ditylenchus destructor]|uniref:BED zinc finger domain-containing protein n=1 Tax=Ditylenchus destructor TaxID=166010 RepID=A0AAD4QTA5_9BILA|nr:BED zinc finger domain-containing protein [Ditylenchus destructor]
MASIREHFDYVGADFAVCKICNVRVSRSGGNTTNIKKHLAKKHPEQSKMHDTLEKLKAEKRKADEKSLMMDQPSIKRFLPNATQISTEETAPSDTLPVSSSCSQISSTVGNTATPSCSSSISPGEQSTLRQSLWREKGPMTQKADRALAQLIAGANLPLSVVEHPAFKNFINILAPSYKLKTRRTLNDKLINDLCAEYERKIKQELTQADAVSLTTDGWTSKNGKHSVLSLTARYISKGTGEPIIRYAGVLPIKGRHTSAHISSLISNAIRFYEVDLSKIHLIIRDAASNMVCAMNILGMNSLDCFAHKMQLAVKEGLSRLGNLECIIEKIKKTIRKLRKSGVDMEKFHEFQEESGLKPLQLIKGIEVRWNSMHDMLVRFLKNKAVISCYKR